MSLLARLIEAGTPADLIEEVAMLVAEKRAAEKAISERREKDAERQRRKRETDAGHVTSRDIADVTGSPSLSPSPKEKISNPHPHTHPETKTRARKGHRLPEDWQPAPLSRDLAAAVEAWPAGALERELARFRDWAASANGPNALKSDWNAAWRNWLRKADDEGRHKRNDPSRPTTSRPTTRQIGERVAARFAAGGGGHPDLVPRLGAPGGYVG